MELDRLEKLAESVEILKERHLSLKAERDKESEALGEAEEKIRALEAERELLRSKIDTLIESIDGLTAGEQS